ncbi:flagellar basal body-associated FliL family protein [Dethiosulfatarculus sandiegensis]|uniref:Flagellar protein FliL n=1 Tax=Dethiosulfatarculus sandiegensis TaxID=1429043 RepID=A0A0D2JCQ4_9BACT|nr:flagellar basal body-associated FliL family protein [Dethiosulfatarculus sandiegensis]KIX13526.1 hypothetical protein X474_13655 [Dethiosulfatarculus sandiegensis]
MAEAIPVAPAADSSEKKADQSSGQVSSFDEDVLADIENSLDLADDDESLTRKAGEKVELDKADLPLDIGPPPDEEQATPKIEVDLAGEGETEITGELEAEDDEAAAKRKKRKKIVTLASILLIALASSGVGFWMGMGGDETKEESPPELKPWVFKGKVPNPETALRIQLEPFLVPLLKSERGGRILALKVSLEVTDQSARQDLTEKTRPIRDAVYRILRDRPSVELRKARAKKLLQAQIKTEINHQLKKDLIYRVFFTEFVITG